MTLAQREHPEAIAEFDAAVRWYEEQERGIGLALTDLAAPSRPVGPKPTPSGQ